MWTPCSRRYRNFDQRAGLTDSPSPPISLWTGLRRVYAEAFGNAMRPVRYAAPWLAILFLMALPLDFLGPLDSSQRPSVSGLDFSQTATLLALILYGSIWLRAELTDDHHEGIALPVDWREAGLLMGASCLLVPALWLWSLAIGLQISIDDRTAMTHFMAGWFGIRTILEIGIPIALDRASMVTALLALLVTALSFRLSPLLIDMALGYPLRFRRAMTATAAAHGRFLLSMLVAAALPYALIAAITDHLSQCCTDNPAIIGVLEIAGTVILFPMTALITCVLALFARQTGYDKLSA